MPRIRVADLRGKNLLEKILFTGNVLWLNHYSMTKFLCKLNKQSGLQKDPINSKMVSDLSKLHTSEQVLL